MTRLRVLVVQAYGENGGAEAWLLRLLDATSALDVQVVILKDGPLRAELARRGIPVQVWPVGRQPYSLIRPVLRLARRLRRDRPDVVLGNVQKAQLVAAVAGRMTGVPTVWGKHDHSMDRWIAAPLGRLSTKVVAGVEEVGAPARRADTVIINPPRPARPPATRDAARQHLRELGVPLPDDAPTFVMAARLVPYKGVDDGIRALAEPQATGWRLVVAGDDDHSSPGETRRLASLAAELGVADRVHFSGHVPDVAHWFAAFDALAVLTRPGGRRDPGMEGFGMTAFESMAAGVPVVAVVGGAVVRRLDGRAGIGVPPADPAAVARALHDLADPAVRAAAGAAGQEIVRDAPDAAACAALLVEVLSEAARSSRRTGRRSVRS